MKNFLLLLSILITGCSDSILSEKDVNWFDSYLDISGKVQLIDEVGNIETSHGGVSIYINGDKSGESLSDGSWEVTNVEPTIETDLSILFSLSNYSLSNVITSHIRGVPISIDSTIYLFETPTYEINDLEVSHFPDSTNNNDPIRIKGNFIPLENLIYIRRLELCISNSQDVSITKKDTIISLSSYSNSDFDSCFISVDFTNNYLKDSLNISDSTILYFSIYPVNSLYESSGYIDPTTNSVIGRSIGNPSEIKSIQVIY